MRGFSIEGPLICKSQWPSSKRREGLGLDTYKISPRLSAHHYHNVGRINMATGSTGSTLPAEWDEVSILLVCLLNSRSQNLVFPWIPRRSRLHRFRGDASSPRCPRTTFSFRLTRPRIPIRTPLPLGGTVGTIGPGNYAKPPFLIPRCPRLVGLSTSNHHPIDDGTRLCAVCSTSISPPSPIPSPQTATFPPFNWKLIPQNIYDHGTEAVGFQTVAKRFLQHKWFPGHEYGRCIPQEICRS
jgi:hypothetical protein